ncbi:cysteine hydrolase family protein [Streptomyces sp. NPDC088560]|uniref:cysteine hydrolase family protein n=1 Tax=Streptomyces sp. NPDC088560 TaxID=3365868 RepID=UPI003829FF7A
MTTLPQRPHTALLVIDVQNGVMAGSPPTATTSSPTSAHSSARPARPTFPVMWVQHSDEELKEGSENWQYVPELVRQDTEPLVPKNWMDSFEDTELESVLSELKVGRLIVTGAQTDACIRSTLTF